MPVLVISFQLLIVVILSRHSGALCVGGHTGPMLEDISGNPVCVEILKFTVEPVASPNSCIKKCPARSRC